MLSHSLTVIYKEFLVTLHCKLLAKGIRIGPQHAIWSDNNAF